MTTVDDPMQLIPTGSYAISAVGGPTVTQTIALGSIGMSTSPAFPWQIGKEQWFTPKNLNLLSTFLQAQTLNFTLTHHSPTVQPDAQIIALGSTLANPTAWQFQLYAQSVLGVNNWIPGAPSFGVDAQYYVQANPPVPTQAIRMIFDVNTSMPTMLAQLIWVTLDNKVQGYFGGKPDGYTITMTKQPTSSIPQNGWYYKSP